MPRHPRGSSSANTRTSVPSVAHRASEAKLGEGFGEASNIDRKPMWHEFACAESVKGILTLLLAIHS